MQATDEILLKTLVVGEPGVGKTSIVKRTCHNRFETNYKATIGVDFALKVIEESGHNLRLQLWDVAGNQRSQEQMTRGYYKDSLGAFVVCDIESLQTKMADSIQGAEKWIDDIRAKVKLKTEDNSEIDIPISLLVNKIDLREDKKLNETEKSAIKAFVDAKNLNGYYLTSAKENTGIEEAIRGLAKKILQLKPNLLPPPPTVALDSPSQNAPKSSGCAC